MIYFLILFMFSFVSRNNPDGEDTTDYYVSVKITKLLNTVLLVRTPFREMSLVMI